LEGLLSGVRCPAVCDLSRVAGKRLAPNYEAARRSRGRRSCMGRWLVAPSGRDKRSQAPTAAYGPGRRLHALGYARVRNEDPRRSCLTGQPQPQARHWPEWLLSADKSCVVRRGEGVRIAASDVQARRPRTIARPQEARVARHRNGDAGGARRPYGSTTPLPHGCRSRVDRVAVTVDDRRTVRSAQPAAAGR
jgi:hypothetical protein